MTADRPLRWLVLATCIRPGGGGGGVVRYTTELVEALVRRDDVEVSLLGDAGSRPLLTRLVGGDRSRVRTPPLALPAEAGALLERFDPWPKTGGFDVVLGTKHLVPRDDSALRALTVHDLLLLDRPDDFPRLKRGLLPGPYRRSIAAADLPICVSEATRRRLAVHDPAAAARAAVVPLAVAGGLLDAVAAPAPVPAGPFVLVVGDASPRKNLATLVRAWPQVRRERPDAVLAIVGPADWSRSGEDAALARLVADGAAVTLGHLPDAQLRWCYEQAAAVVCPSIAEGFGLPVAEALALGAPVVVSDDAALAEAAAGRQAATVRSGDTAGWAAAIVAVLAAGTRTGPRIAARPRTWDDVAAETVAAARDALSRRGPAPRRAGPPAGAPARRS